MNEVTNNVPAVDRALDVLEYVGSAGQSVPIRNLASSLGIPQASCFRIVKSLISRGYLIEDYNISGQYVLGFNILKLSNQIMQKMDIRSIALNFMRQIAVKTNQVVQLGVLQNKGVMYIEQTLPVSPINTLAPLKTILPVNVSASGKVLCAYMPLHLRVDFLREAEFDKYTNNTIINKDLFMKELETVREKGYAVDDEEYSIGIGCIAVPIFDFNGNCVASLGITGTVSDYKDKVKHNMALESLKETSEVISKRLGFQQ